MDELFLSIAAVPNPGKGELSQFTRDVESFLSNAVEDDEFAFLWTDAPELRALARETLREDVSRSGGALRDAIKDIQESRLVTHGLRGRPLRFKFNVLASVARLWSKVKGKLTIRGWFKKMCEAIDAVLDSLIQAAGAIGGALKEFKDALSALVPESERAA